jgi:alpha-tubulin suppressor-like RCC1 family protein
VVAVGYNKYGQCDVGNWTGIIKVAAGFYHTVGLRADGTVVAVGRNDCGQCNVGIWTDIIQISGGWGHTVGLKSNGTVVAAGTEVELAKRNLGDTTRYLTISSTAGGEVTLPEEGTFPYYRGRVLNLVAQPENGYRFINWTGDVGTIANVNAAQTTITINDNYSIAANFEEKPPVNWALIGGFIGAAVVAGLVIFFVRRRRPARTKRRKRR